MTRTLLSAAALALLMGAGPFGIHPALAQNGGDVRSTDRDMKKKLDDRELTPVRPIRRVGPDSWPAAKNPRPTNLPAETNGRAAKDDSLKSSDAKRNTAKQDSTKPDAAQTKQAQQPARDQRAQKPATDNDKAKEPNNEANKADDKSEKADKGFASIRLGTDAHGRVAVNDSQERQISNALRKRDVKSVNVDIRVGAVAPRDVRLAAVSSDIVAVLPQFRGYSFFVTREKIAFVAPDSRKVVAVVPVKLTATASKPQEERSTRGETRTRKTVTREREVTVGRGVPTEAEILAAPTVVVPGRTTVTRTYRVEQPETVIIEQRRPRIFGLW